MATYTGRDLHVVEKDGVALPLFPSLQVQNHSPTGFSWGYGGSGPAQLALALLLEETDEETAVARYQQFKWDVIARLPARWRLSSDHVQGWLKWQTHRDGFVPRQTEEGRCCTSS